MKPMSRNNKGRVKRTEEGLTLIETLVAMVILLVVMAGLALLLVLGVRADDANQRQVEVLNVARDKLEQIQTIPYEQVGIMPGGGGTSGGGSLRQTRLSTPLTMPLRICPFPRRSLLLLERKLRSRSLSMPSIMLRI